MPETKIPSESAFSRFRGSHLLLGLLADKWTIPVVHALARGTKRFGELRQQVGGVSQKMLTQCLRRLEAHGLVRRTVYPVVPPHVEYSLTSLGKSLNEPLAGICTWITRHGRQLERESERAE
jgi:DNA-binding HxlR family transcriptional regulator